MSQEIRDIVLSSLSAIGANHEAKFYAQLFSAQDAERFALVVIDPRCLKNPLLESLIGSLRILKNLGLTPVLLVGALDEDRTSVRFQSQRLARDMEQSNIGVVKLDTATYGLIPDIRKVTRTGRLVVLEMTNRSKSMDLPRLAEALKSNKILFLQPSGGLTQNGSRIKDLTIDEIPELLKTPGFSQGQIRFLRSVMALDANTEQRRAYVIASPLNLLMELFTTKGSGTLIRRKVIIKRGQNFKSFVQRDLQNSMENAFGKKMKAEFFKRDLYRGFIVAEYRGGALFNELEGLPYLSKFWITKAAQGDGIARDIWADICDDIPRFFWRSRMENPFNDWYMHACDGMQRRGDWRVFWKGLSALEIPKAIETAALAPDDFK
ncbi:MAG: hypothetical protein ABJG88_03305 [Litorimonas sp.]